MGFSQKAIAAVAIVLIAATVVPAYAILNWGNPFEPPIETPSPTDKPQASNTPDPSSTLTPNPNTPSPTENPGKTTNTDKKPDPTLLPLQLGPIESAPSMNSNVWKSVGANAWNYFRPGYGVNETTGLPCSGNSYPYFTDWDLGVYIQAVIDASKLGLISNDGTWGFNDRIGKVLTFLENRELNSYGYPYWFYQADDGDIFHNNSDVAGFTVDTADSGRMLVALGNLQTYNTNLTTRINNFVYNVDANRSNYEALVPGLQVESTQSTSIYSYYACCGFAHFWPTDLANATTNILDNIYASGSVNVSGVMLPQAAITSDVLLCAVFETPNDARLSQLMYNVYLAHQAFYQANGTYRAFGEGASSSTWQWEWVVRPDGQTWVVLDGSGNVTQSSPVIYTKVAFGFLALYNSDFARSMSVFIEHAWYSFSNGYGEGIDEAHVPIYSVAMHTNGLILDAAVYGYGV